MVEEREKLRNEFIRNCKLTNYRVESIKSDASYRKYFRIFTEEQSLILMDAPPDKENVKSFIDVDEILQKCNLSVPEIFSQDTENGFLLLSDFGNNTYKQVLSSNENIYVDEKILYERAVDVLIHLHKNHASSDFLKSLNLEKYTSNMLLKESKLFMEWYLAIFNQDKLDQDLQNQFELIMNELFEQIKLFPDAIVLRDYHAENIFWLDNEVGIRKVGLIDFQDAVIGSSIYDIVSLLEDARRDVSEEIVINSISRYLKAFPQYTRKEFMGIYSILGVARNLKILGIFTRQAVKYKNQSYLAMIPRVWKYINNNLKNPILFPLKSFLEKVIPSQLKASQKKERLLV